MESKPRHLRDYAYQIKSTTAGCGFSGVTRWFWHLWTFLPVALVTLGLLGVCMGCILFLSGSCWRVPLLLLFCPSVWFKVTNQVGRFYFVRYFEILVKFRQVLVMFWQVCCDKAAGRYFLPGSLCIVLGQREWTSTSWLSSSSDIISSTLHLRNPNERRCPKRKWVLFASLAGFFYSRFHTNSGL